MKELYKLRCHVCHCEVELPTSLRSCARCGVTFEIDWDAERREYQQSVGQGTVETHGSKHRDRSPDTSERGVTLPKKYSGA